MIPNANIDEILKETYGYDSNLKVGFVKGKISLLLMKEEYRLEPSPSQQNE